MNQDDGWSWREVEPGMGGAWQGGEKEGELGRREWREWRPEEGWVTFLRFASFSRLFPPTAETWGHLWY